MPAVDTHDRAQVLALYRNYYLVPTPPPAWTGNSAARDAGAVGDAFLCATLRRVNYYRAMAGLRGDVTFDPALNSVCQQAALLCALAHHISHEPPTSWKGYTRAAANAALNSSLCLNWSADLGPGAIDAYADDDQPGNAAVGHRRWLFYPFTRVMGAGIVPTRAGVHPGTNALWCRPTAEDFTAASTSVRQHDLAVTTTAWPPAGYMPAPLVSRRWSFSCANADFRTARVRVTKNGRTLPVSLERLAFQTSADGRGRAVGLNTLAWRLPGNTVRRDADENYDVRLSNVGVDGAARDFHYQVVSIDPASP